MEQQKLELLMKTRQNARAAARGRGKSYVQSRLEQFQFAVVQLTRTANHC